MKEFIYLVQGRAERIAHHFHLCERERADAILLTWDEPLDGAEYFPESTWTQGRNRLLELAQTREPYAYYIFCDDDIAFRSGSWDVFERLLLKYRPAFAAPVMPRLARFWKIPLVQCQGIVMTDEQLAAFHRNTIMDRILMPLQERFDHITPHMASEIQEILIRNIYAGRAVHFNKVVIDNPVHEERAHTPFNFRPMVLEWLRSQFRPDARVKDIWRRRPESLLYESWYTLLFYAGLFFGDNTRPITRERRLKKLRKTSVFVDGA